MIIFLFCLSCYSQQGTVAKLSPKKRQREKSLGTADVDCLINWVRVAIQFKHLEMISQNNIFF
jgi:hypothetical protein